MIKIVAAAALTVIGTVTAAAQTAPIKWRLTSYVSQNSNLYTMMAQPLVKRIHELTDGQLQIELFPEGVIAPAFRCQAAVSEGLAEACQAPLSILFGRHPSNAFFGFLPGGMPADALMSWMYVGGGKELLAEVHRDTLGLHTLPAGLGGTEIFAHSHKPLRNAADLKGLKIRTVGPAASIMQEAFGGAPITVPGAEVFSMLERKGIDATEWSGPADNVTMGFSEVARYIIYPGVHTKAYFAGLSVKKETWDALPDHLKRKVEAAAMLNSMESLLRVDQEDIKAWKKLKSGKNEIIRLDDSVITAYKDGARKFATKLAADQKAKGDNWTEKVADSYLKFYDEWFENSEFRSAK